MKTSTAPAADSTAKRPPLKPLTTFYVLWRVGGARPRRRHRTIEAAYIERGRLRALNPDARYTIYEMRLVVDGGAPR
jgi:hypothetical protein